MSISRMKRLWHSAMFALLFGERKREYVMRHKLFAGYGNGVIFQPHLLPLYSQLISIHDYVIVGRNVEFVTHDMIHKLLNSSSDVSEKLHEQIGCIEVMDNCFIGNGAIIMMGVRINTRSIIAAGSVVTKDTEPDSIYAGVPARRIGSFSDYARKRVSNEKASIIATVQRNQRLSEDEAAFAWRLFEATHSELNSA